MIPLGTRPRANVLYDLIEEEVAPQFYSRDKHGIPVEWLDKVRESMVTLTARFSSNRAVREYTESYYLPAAAAFEQRRADDAGLGRELVDWQTRIHEHWSGLRFGHMEISSGGGVHEFQVHVLPGKLKPEDIAVELYADPLIQGERATWPMARWKDLPGPKCRDHLPGACFLHTFGGPLHGPDRSRSCGGIDSPGSTPDFMATLTGTGCWR